MAMNRRMQTFLLIQCCLIPNVKGFVPGTGPKVFSSPQAPESPPISMQTSPTSSKQPTALFYNPLESDDESAEGKDERMESVRRLQEPSYVEPRVAPLRHGVLSSLPIWMENYVSVL